MGEETQSYEFFEMIPLNPAEAQAAEDAAADPQWSRESRRVTRKVATLGRIEIELL